MIRNTFRVILALAIALAIPAFAVPDHGSDGGQGHDGNGNNGTSTTPPPVAGQVQNNAQNDHGDDNQAGNQPQAGDPEDNDNPAPAAFERFRANLAASAAGMAAGASGNVAVRAQGHRQRLKVEIEADVPDGTMFNVLANGIPVGVLSTSFGQAELELDTEVGQPLPAGLLPGTITSAVVTDSGGTPVLQAQFGAVAPMAGQPPAPPVPDREDLTMIVTSQGMAVGASGHVSRRIQGQRQRLHVEVEANVSDGAVFRVFADGIPVGSLTFRLHEAEFQLESENAMLPTGLDSIAAIKTVQVVDAGGAVLLTTNL